MEDQLLKIEATLKVVLENQAFIMGALGKQDDDVTYEANEYKKQFDVRIEKKLNELKLKSIS
jgi:hypothetical protein